MYFRTQDQCFAVVKKYKQRIADRLLAEKFADKGAVLIEGPRWCGKSTTVEQFAKDSLYTDGSTEKKQPIQMSDITPGMLLVGKTLLSIDEWQNAPQYARLTMRPMSLFESGESTGEVSLNELFGSPGLILAENQLRMSDIAFLICRGGWPGAIELDTNLALKQVMDYYNTITKTEISKVDGVRRNPKRIKLLMHSYARYQGITTQTRMIPADLQDDDIRPVKKNTASIYLEVLKKMFIIENAVPWHPTLRNKTIIRKSETRYYVDPSIGVAALGIGPNDLTKYPNIMESLFETLCIRDLRIFADALDGQVYNFRGEHGLKCDAVIQLRNGKYGLIDITLGGDALIEESVSTLKRLAGKIDINKMGTPSFLMVLTGTERYAFRRRDGIYVIPIGCLRD